MELFAHLFRFLHEAERFFVLSLVCLTVIWFCPREEKQLVDCCMFLLALTLRVRFFFLPAIQSVDVALVMKYSLKENTSRYDLDTTLFSSLLLLIFVWKWCAPPSNFGCSCKGTLKHWWTKRNLETGLFSKQNKACWQKFTKVDGSLIHFQLFLIQYCFAPLACFCLYTACSKTSAHCPTSGQHPTPARDGDSKGHCGGKVDVLSGPNSRRACTCTGTIHYSWWPVGGNGSFWFSASLDRNTTELANPFDLGKCWTSTA